jgi:hypothetical protein
MKTYTVTGPVVALALGTLALTSAQAGLRAHALDPLGEDRYNIRSRVEFKKGETFGYDQEIPKALADCLEECHSKSLEDMDPVQLLAMARSMGLNPHPNTGKPKLLEAIKIRQEELQAGQEAAEKKAARLAELEAKGDDLSDEEKAELAGLKA